jgi:hypothetical protein
MVVLLLKWREVTVIDYFVFGVEVIRNVPVTELFSWSYFSTCQQ